MHGKSNTFRYWLFFMNCHCFGDREFLEDHNNNEVAWLTQGKGAHL
jgi:hypothetical protein